MPRLEPKGQVHWHPVVTACPCGLPGATMGQPAKLAG